MSHFDIFDLPRSKYLDDLLNHTCPTIPCELEIDGCLCTRVMCNECWWYSLRAKIQRIHFLVKVGFSRSLLEAVQHWYRMCACSRTVLCSLCIEMLQIGRRHFKLVEDAQKLRKVEESYQQQHQWQHSWLLSSESDASENEEASQLSTSSQEAEE